MDFLDPKRKKAHRRRLFLGYILMAVVLAMGTWLLLVSARGFDYDRKTGSIIQNGYVYTDSKPGGATVFLNNTQQRDKTSSRLALPAGQYDLRLELDGYRNWSRTVLVNGGGIERIV